MKSIRFKFGKGILTGVFLILFGCNSNSNSGHTNRRNGAKIIDLERENSLSVFDLFSKVEVIPLETNDRSVFNFLTGQPDQVLLHGGKFYFLDKKQNAILLFEKNGAFIKKISKKGRGAGEYVSISDFHINRYTGNLEILSEFGNINIYDPMGDEFLETIKLPFSAVHYFCNISPDIYCFYSSAQGGEIVFYSKAKSQKIGNSNYKLPEWLRSTIYSPSKSPFYIYKDSVCFEQLYNGDVSTITEHDLDLKPRYYWDFGESNFNLSEIPAGKDMNFYLDLTKKIGYKYPNLFQIYAENEKYYFTRFKFKNRYNNLIYVKKTSEYYLFDEFKEGVSFLPLAMDSDAAYAFVSPFYLEKLVNNKILDVKNQKTVNNINADNNLIVLKYTFKK